MSHHQDPSSDEFQPVISLLVAHRPEATGLELDAVKQRVLARTAKQSRNQRSSFMRSRAAILSTLALGFMLSTTGAGLAVSGFTASDQASDVQYPAQVTPTTPESVTPTTPPAPAGEATPLPEQQVLPGNEESPAAPESVQPTQQVEAGVASTGGEELPFTGFAAIPVLLVGIALLGAGMVMRRTSRTSAAD
jgi:hypothetical protein